MAHGWTWLGIVAALIGMAPAVAVAQDQDVFQQQASSGTLDTSFSVEQLPAVYVTNLNLTATNANIAPLAVGKEGPLPPTVQPQVAASPSPNLLTGTFSLTNQDSQPQSGLRYELLIMDARQSYEVENIGLDDPRVYYHVALGEDVGVGAKSSTELTIQHEVPPLPDAPYRARIQVLTADGRQLGWQDAPVVLGGLSQAFVTLTATGINTGSLVEGVVVNPGQALTLRASVDTGGVAIEEPLTPHVTTRTQLGASDQVDTASMTLAPITITASEKQDITLPIQASSEAGSYVVSVALHDAAGTLRSSTADYVYVTRGPSASIVRQSLISVNKAEPQVAQVEFTIAGSADRETDLNGSVQVDLLLKDEVVASTESSLTLAAGQTKTGTATLTLERKICTSPDIRTTAKDSQGKVLAEQQTETSADITCAFSRRSPIFWGLIVGAGILVIAIVSLLLRGRGGRPAPPATPRASGTIVGGLLILAAIAGAFSLTSHKTALASGIQWQTGSSGHALLLFVNQPQHQTTVNARLGLDYEARLTYTSSNATPVEAQLTVSLLAPGGHVDNPNNRNWTRIGGGSAALSNAQNPRTLSLASRLPLPAGYNHATSTLWTAATVVEGTDDDDDDDDDRNSRSIHDLSWVTFDYGPGGGQGPGTGVGSCLTPQITTANTNTCQEARATFKVKNTCQPSAGRGPVDLVLVMDRSGSMGSDNKMPAAKVAAHILLNQLDPAKDRAALISYADFARTDLGLTSNIAQVKSAVNGMQPQGWTNVAHGVSLGRSQLASVRAGATPIMIVLTDGIANRRLNGSACESYPYTPTACTQDAINEAAAAKAAGVTMFTVGFDLGGNVVPRNMLRQMASSPNQAFDAPSAAQLQAAFAAIAQEITNKVASNAVLTYVLPSGVSYIPNSGSPAPSSTVGQVLTWNLGIVSVGEEPSVSFAVSLSDGRTQPISVSPDSRLTYNDNKNQSQVVILPATTHSPMSCTTTSGPPECPIPTQQDTRIQCLTTELRKVDATLQLPLLHTLSDGGIMVYWYGSNSLGVFDHGQVQAAIQACGNATEIL
ncbi:MAG: vWA domain-containing protein, partial [Patescibacteria group bacterium]